MYVFIHSYAYTEYKNQINFFSLVTYLYLFICSKLTEINFNWFTSNNDSFTTDSEHLRAILNNTFLSIGFIYSSANSHSIAFSWGSGRYVGGSSCRTNNFLASILFKKCSQFFSLVLRRSLLYEDHVHIFVWGRQTLFLTFISLKSNCIFNNMYVSLYKRAYFQCWPWARWKRRTPPAI